MNVGEPSYWEVRYSQEIPKMMTFKLFDWYVSFGKVFSMVENVMDKTLSPKVLVIGVGRSNIIDTLYGQNDCISNKTLYNFETVYLI